VRTHRLDLLPALSRAPKGSLPHPLLASVAQELWHGRPELSVKRRTRTVGAESASVFAIVIQQLVSPHKM